MSKEYVDIHEDKVIQDIIEPPVAWVLGVLLFLVLVVVGLLIGYGVLM